MGIFFLFFFSNWDGKHCSTRQVRARDKWIKSRRQTELEENELQMPHFVQRWTCVQCACLRIAFIAFMWVYRCNRIVLKFSSIWETIWKKWINEFAMWRKIKKKTVNTTLMWYDEFNRIHLHALRLLFLEISTQSGIWHLDFGKALFYSVDKSNCECWIWFASIELKFYPFSFLHRNNGMWGCSAYNILKFCISADNCVRKRTLLIIIARERDQFLQSIQWMKFVFIA